MALLANQLLLQKILKKPVNVDGSHIIDRSITFIDISLATIQGSNITNDTIDFSNLSTSAISSLTTTPPNSIDGSHIINRSITGIDIALETIKGENIQDRTITGLDIGLQEIKEENIVGLAVTELKIGGLAVTEGKIGALAVTEGKIGALAVTEGKIGALAVTDAKIATGTISLGKLSAGAISSLQTTPSNSIDSSHIINGSILGEDISAGTIDLSNLSTACISSLTTAGAPAPNSINSSHIIDGAILGTDISDRTITASNIVLGTITKFEILDGTITGAKIGSSTIEGGNIAPATIEYNNLSNNLVLTLINSQGANTINTTHILDGTILGTDIQAGTITSNNIQDGTITGTDIQDNAITTGKVADGNITYAKLNTNITSILNNNNISRNYIGQTGTVHSLYIPIDLVNNQFVDVDLGLRFVNYSDRFWSEFDNGSIYGYRFYRLSSQNIYNNAEVFVADEYKGMTMRNMETSSYWGAANIRLRIYNRFNADADPKLYNVEGDSFFGQGGIGPVRATIFGTTEYKPTYMFFSCSGSGTFIAKYYVTNYK